MGTRSITKFIESEGNKQKAITAIYRQFDGYPTGHGLDLAEFLNQGILVNGIGMKSDKLQFTGMGCLAAQVIHHLKDGPGGIYIEHPDRENSENYYYEVIGNSFKPKEITIKCYQGDKLLFEGTPEEIEAMLNNVKG